MRLAKITTAIIAFVIITVFTVCAFNSGVVGQKLDFNVPKLQSTEAKLKSVNIEYESLNMKLKTQSSSDKETIDKLNTEKAKLQKQQQDLQKQLESKADEKAKLAQVAAATVNTVTATSIASAEALPSVAVANCGDNSYANYIYSHESGCRTHNPNSEGCDGIGQACPASKVIDNCGYDYTCQNAWFTSYAQKYCYLGTGTNCWEGAYNFWVANRWW